MAIKEMAAMITPPTTEYNIMIPEFSPDGAMVLIISMDTTGTYPKTIVDIAAEGAANDYTFSQSGTQWSVNFSTNVVNNYIAFVVRVPYVKPYNSWVTLISNNQINYDLLNNQNTAIYKWFYDSYDFDYDRRLVLESTYKFEEMRVVPYLDDQFIWMKDGDKIIAIHRKDLIKDELAEINSILNTIRQIQADIITRQIDITNKWNDVKTLAAQVLIWRNDTENFYNLSLTLKNQMQDLYNDYEYMADNKFNTFVSMYNDSVTQLGSLINAGVITINNTADTRLSEINTVIDTGKTDIINLNNSAVADITLSRNTSLADIEQAKEDAIKAIQDAAEEIIGGDFLVRGGTTYANAKEIEDDIIELKSQPSGAAVIIGEIDETTSTSITLILNKADMSGQETISQNIQYTMIAGSGIGATPGLLVNVKVNGVVFPLKRETFDESTVYRDVKTDELIQYQSYIFFYNPWSAAYFLRTNFLATNNVPGLMTKKQVTLAQYDYVDVNVSNTRSNADIINDLNDAFTSGKKARLYNMQFPNKIPNPGMYNEGMLTFTVSGSGSLLLTFLPKYANSVDRLEANVILSNGLIPTVWNFYTRDNWKHYGTEELIGINQTVTLNDGRTYVNLTAVQCGITGSLNIFKEITLFVSVRTSRHQNYNGSTLLELGGKFTLNQNLLATFGQDNVNYLNKKTGTDVVRVWGTKSLRENQLGNNWIYLQLSNSGYSISEPITGDCIVQIISAIGKYY